MSQESVIIPLDISRKFDRLRDAISDLQRNEDDLKVNVANAQEQVRINNERYEVLRRHAETKLRQATEELERRKTSGEANISKLKAMLRRAELKISNLEETLDHKTKENGELCQIVDELINKVGGK